MNDFINSPPLPEYREEERCDYNTQGPVIRELTWQRDQLKLSLDEMALLIHEQPHRSRYLPAEHDAWRKRKDELLAKHGYLPRKEPK